MEDIEKLIELTSLSLKRILKQLEVLEIKKQNIILMYNKTTLNKNESFVSEIKKLEEDMRNLCDQVLTVAEELKEIKNKKL